MPASKAKTPGWLRSFHVTVIVIGCAIAIAAIGSPQLAAQADTDVDAEADFHDRIRPLVKTYCFDCHSSTKKKGGLDLERFAMIEQVRADVEHWQSVLEMLEGDEMPPNGEPHPTAEERGRLIGWTRGFLEHEAQRRAGDPGPVLTRRLNNAEYRYTIRDLTGVDLRPARQFPADGAAGEGFLNATEALAISPDRITKYLDAAKEIAGHAVLLPHGFRVSPSKFREDWVNEVLAEIVALHRKFATELGEIPVDRYLSASVVHRDALRAGETSIDRVAEKESLSPKYLQVLWQFMNDERASPLLDGLRAKWRKCAPADSVAVPGGQDAAATVSNLVAEILALQGLLWHKRAPTGAHALDDRFVPADIALAESHAYRLEEISKPDAEAVFYLSAHTIAGQRNRADVILERPRFESENETPLLLRDALRVAIGDAAGGTAGKDAPAATEGVSRLDASWFGPKPGNEQLDETDLLLSGSEVLEVRLPGSLVSKRTFVVEARLDPGTSPETLVHFDVRRTPSAPRDERSLAWHYSESGSRRPILMVGNDEAVRKSVGYSADEFRQVFPVRVCYPGVIVRDTVVTLERFHRGDRHLSRLLLGEPERERLDRLWEELHFISQDALQVRNSLSTLTQGEMTGYKHVKAEILRRAEQTEKNLVAAEPSHLQSLLEFASRAYRRPLTELERQSLLDLYQSLRNGNMPHNEAFRSVMARVLVSPNFLFRIEQPQPGKEAQRVTDWELAARLSYFLWSSMPDDELRQAAAAGRLSDPPVLEQQTLRMLRDPRSRALAIEFGTQWLEVRNFGQFQGKDEQLYPTFNATLRKAMDEESILFFCDMFQADRPFRQLLDADHTFLNEALAVHYGIPGIQGDAFRRVDGVREDGRGGLLGLSTVLAKHSGASRTSPVLRGIWVAETLLGDRLPRPPEDVPKLPDGEAEGALTVRQLVEKHASLEQCAVCHQRFDPLGFALEEFDTIGRMRSKDLGGRPVDAKALLKDGTHFEGIEGLRQYLLTQRRDEFLQQFCRKLLGYALGRRVLLSDRQLLKKMVTVLDNDDARLSAAVLVIVHSKPFQFIRGSEFEPTDTRPR